MANNRQLSIVPAEILLFGRAVGQKKKKNIRSLGWVIYSVKHAPTIQ